MRRGEIAFAHSTKSVSYYFICFMMLISTIHQICLWEKFLKFKIKCIKFKS